MNGTPATPADERSDATLVAAAIAGDRHAFAGIYDRYADRMHDFCWSLLRSPDEAADATQDTFVIAAGKLHQLRDPDRLRPWLYAVARSVAMGQLRDRRRERAEADFDDIVDVGDGPHEVAHRSELRDLVWEAAQGLSDRDRMVLDLHLRQGLEGRDLAVAMAVSENNANVMLSRVRDRVERSLGAFLVARLGSEHCEELQALLRNWDGRFTPLIRKRVARHVDACDACDARRRAVASPWALLGAVPLVPAPAALRDRVLDQIDLTSAGRAGHGGPRLPAKVAAVAVAALIGTGGVVAGAQALRGRPAITPTTAATPTTAVASETTTLPLDGTSEATAGLRLSPRVLRLQAGDRGVLTVRNLGDGPVTWTATTTASWLTVDRATGTVAAGMRARIEVSTDDPPAAGATATITVVHDGGGTATAEVEVAAARRDPTDRQAPAPQDPGTDPDPVTPGEEASAPATRQPSEPAPDDPRTPTPDDPPTREPQPPGNEDPGKPDPGREDPVDPQRPATGRANDPGLREATIPPQ